MKITFDPAERATTLEERGLDFADAAEGFAGRSIRFEDHRRDYGERRFQTIGFANGPMVIVVWTPRGDARHIISMRKCNAREQTKYGQRLGEG